MKHIKFLIMIVALISAASCSKTSGEKASGNYSGSYKIDSTATYPVSGTIVAGSIDISKVSDSQVNMLLICNSPSLSDASNGVTLTTSGDNINFSYSNPSTTEYDMLSLDGTISGNTITVDGIMYMSGGNGVGTFTGSK